MKAREVMTSEVVSVGPEMPTWQVAQLLLEKGISAVPVVDDGGTPIGMVIAQHRFQEADLERFAEIEHTKSVRGDASAGIAWRLAKQQRVRVARLDGHRTDHADQSGRRRARAAPYRPARQDAGARPCRGASAYRRDRPDDRHRFARPRLERPHGIPSRASARRSACASRTCTRRTAAYGRRTCLTPLNTSPAPSPVNASRLPSRAARASLGAGAVRYSFTVTDFHRPPLAGLPAHSSTHHYGSRRWTSQSGKAAGRAQSLGWRDGRSRRRRSRPLSKAFARSFPGRQLPRPAAPPALAEKASHELT